MKGARLCGRLHRALHPAAVLQSKPGGEVRLSFPQADHPGAVLEVFTAIGVVAGGPAIAQGNPVQSALKVVEMIVTGEDTTDIASKVQCGKKASVDARTADSLIHCAEAEALLPKVVEFRKRDVKKDQHR